MNASLGDSRRLVLWVGSGDDSAFPPENVDRDRVLAYVNSSGAPHPQPEERRLPQQPRFLLVWLPPPELADAELVAEFLSQVGSGGRSSITHCLAAYASTGGLPAPASKPGYAGLMVGMTDCVDADALEEFQDWYDNVHAAEALAPGIFETARRYRRLGPAVPGSFPAEAAGVSPLPAPEFLALYESVRPGPEAVSELVRPENRPPSPLHPSCRIRGFWAFDRR